MKKKKRKNKKSNIIKQINWKLEQIQILSNKERVIQLAEEIMLEDLPQLLKELK